MSTEVEITYKSRFAADFAVRRLFLLFETVVYCLKNVIFSFFNKKIPFFCYKRLKNASVCDIITAYIYIKISFLNVLLLFEDLIYKIWSCIGRIFK